ncbi:hypothetical protein C1645_419405 [Glomus cerebriforme]|uniref:Uncharacterized protein n=1 Tax=Glomus cerebriforme TaxID=658196 RepID=A0A397TSD1_9GLOM|nr:hypothetical protein C1645_419405 [Glomus cerebriforme]
MTGMRLMRVRIVLIYTIATHIPIIMTRIKKRIHMVEIHILNFTMKMRIPMVKISIQILMRTRDSIVGIPSQILTMKTRMVTMVEIRIRIRMKARVPMMNIFMMTIHILIIIMTRTKTRVLLLHILLLITEILIPSIIEIKVIIILTVRIIIKTRVIMDIIGGIIKTLMIIGGLTQFHGRNNHLFKKITIYILRKNKIFIMISNYI